MGRATTDAELVAGCGVDDNPSGRCGVYCLGGIGKGQTEGLVGSMRILTGQRTLCLLSQANRRGLLLVRAGQGGAEAVQKSGGAVMLIEGWDYVMGPDPRVVALEAAVKRVPKANYMLNMRSWYVQIVLDDGQEVLEDMPIERAIKFLCGLAEAQDR